MKTQIPFKRLILRAVLRKVSPMVIRVLAVPDYLDLSGFDEIFRTLLGWDGLGFSSHIHIHGYGIFNCVPERHFSIRAEESIFGNASSGFSTLKREVTAMARRCLCAKPLPGSKTETQS